MEKVKCKECGKEINKKAEICPHCGCRVKSNTLKIVIICLIIAGLLVIGYKGAKYIKHQIDENKRLETERIEKEKRDKLNKEETKIYESYLGKYKISYDLELFKKEHPYYEIKDTADFSKKCYQKDSTYPKPQDGDILTDCLSIENAKTIEEVHSFDNYRLYLNDKNNIIYAEFRSITKSCNIPSASTEDINESSLQSNYICFSGNSNELNQVNCPKEIYSKKTTSDTSWDSKYKFKLTKIK